MEISGDLSDAIVNCIIVATIWWGRILKTNITANIEILQTRTLTYKLFCFINENFTVLTLIIVWNTKE